MAERHHKGIVIISFLIPVCIYLMMHLSFPFSICDDAYITLKSAVNLSDGNGLVFNAGEKAYVLTNPLWAFLLAIGRSLGFDIALVIRALCVLFQVTFLISAVYLGYIVTKNPETGALFAVLMITNPIYYLSSEAGIEYALFFTFVMLGFILFIRKYHIWSLIAAAITIWIRFDGFLLYAVLLLSYLFMMFRNEKIPPLKIVLGVIPSLLIFIAYFVFGFLYYGDMFPQSVQMKVSESPIMFSSEWFDGAYNTFLQILFAVNFGCLSFFYNFPGFFFIFTIFSPIAFYHIFKTKQFETLSLVIYTILYSLAFIGNGSADALGYSWYYCPPLLLAYLFSAWGIMLAFKGVIKNEKNARRFNMLMLLLVVFITLIWMPLSLNRLNKIAQNVEASIPKREIAFAVSAIWSGKHLPEKACIAADDLGAIGFFARPDIKVVDIYGILRTPQDKHLDRIDILKREKPEAMFLRFKRLFGEEIESGLPGEYIWLKFGHLDLALRRDIAQKLLPDENELIQIENELDLNREYKW